MDSPTSEAPRTDPLNRVQAYQLAMLVLAEAKADADSYRKDPFAREVGSQLLRAIASIAANIAEGYSRGTPADRRRFFEYALGSTRESLVWYEAVPQRPPQDRLDRLESIRRLLLTMIRNSRASAAADAAVFGR